MALAIGLTGCAGTPRRDVYATGDPQNYASLGYRLAWSGFPLMERGAEVRFFEPMGDVVGVQTSQGAISIIEGRTGGTRWATPLGGPTTRFLGLTRAGDRVIAISDTDLYAFDIVTGGQTARQNLSVVANTAPRAEGDLVYYGSSTGQAVGHDLVTGFKAWGYMLRGSISARPALTSDAVFFVSQGGDAIALNPLTGSSLGRDRIFGGVESDPVAGEGAFFLASLDQAVYGFAASDGRMLWRRLAERPIRSQLSLINGVVYISIPGEGMVAIDATTGRDLWTSPEVSGRIVGMRSGRLIGWTGAEALRIDPRTGAVESRTPLPRLHDLVMAPPVDGDLYAVAPQGVVTKYTPRD